LILNGLLLRLAIPEHPASYAKTLSFFRSSRAASIDFGQIAPMFRFDAARYRNAISW
jgi:hypothetical protein